MESSEEAVALEALNRPNSAVLEWDTHDLRGQERKMSRGGPRVAVGRTRTVIAKKGGRPESREETPKEGIYGREPAPQQSNAAMQQLQAGFCRFPPP